MLSHSSHPLCEAHTTDSLLSPLGPSKADLITARHQQQRRPCLQVQPQPGVAPGPGPAGLVPPGAAAAPTLLQPSAAVHSTAIAGPRRLRGHRGADDQVKRTVYVGYIDPQVGQAAARGCLLALVLAA